MLDEALSDADGPVARADVQHLRGRIMVSQGRTRAAFELLTAEAERVRAVDPGRSAAMLTEACFECALSADVARALAMARGAYALASHSGDELQAFAGVMLAGTLTLSGEGLEASLLLDRFMPLLTVLDPISEAGNLVAVGAEVLLWLERHDAAAALLERIIAAARAASAPAPLLLPLSSRADLNLRLGRWPVAIAEAQEAASLGHEMARSVFAAYAFECLAQVAAAQGDEQACREHAASAMELVEDHDNELGRLYVLSALGLLELGLGRPEAALEPLEAARELTERHGLNEPNVVRWHADLIEARLRAGDLAAASRSLTDLEEQARRTSGRWALGTALRCRGLLVEDNGEADACFAAALRHLEAVGATFEIARTHFNHGERLRRCGRRVEARRALRMAADRFQTLGATVWLERATSELRASGGNARRRVDAARNDLTAQEMQVALVVARGASNREAAAAMFLSTKTIEFHLAHIYRKLDVRTRTELAALVARRGWLDAQG
jgi:DNA-binding CsgD family transcriptional regulator